MITALEVKTSLLIIVYATERPQTRHKSAHNEQGVLSHFCRSAVGSDVALKMDALLLLVVWSTFAGLICISGFGTPLNTNEGMSSAEKCASQIAHSQAAIALAAKESAEQMEGMDELYTKMRTRRLVIRAYPLDGSNALTVDQSGTKNIKTVHFLRHGEG